MLRKEIHSDFKVYKPVGILSQLSSGEDRQLRKKRFLTELYDFPKNTMPVGRLDEKSEGLLLMTTDGKLSDKINNSGIEKEYWAQLDGEITLDAIKMMESGIVINIHGKSYTTKPCKVQLITDTPAITEPDKKLRIGRHRPTSWIRMILREGKFRQIRKMTAAVGFPTLRLVRVRIGAVHLGELEVGEVCPIDLEFLNLKNIT